MANKQETTGTEFTVGDKVRYKVGRGRGVAIIEATEVDGDKDFVCIRTEKGKSLNRKKAELTAA